MSDAMLKDALECVNNRQFQEATVILKELLESAEQDDPNYFKGIKLYADILGPITGHDYNLAIDFYQQVVNQCEDDALYQSAQISMLTSYLNLSIHYMETFENTIDVIESTDDNTTQILAELNAQREKFIIQRAESIYKERM